MHYNMNDDTIKEGDHMHVASINLRVNVPVDGPYAWPYRKDRMIQFILKQNFDIIGCQEAFKEMVDDLYEGLKSTYHMIVHPRDARGESTPILYKKTLNPTFQKTSWLTDTPDRESMIMGSHFPRIVTMARFDHVLFINTHLDYASDDISLIQAKYLINIINQTKQEDDQIILVGDFNTYPESQTIRFISTHLTSIYGDQHVLTFHGFTPQKEGQPIDYIFTSSPKMIRSWTVHDDHPGIYLSDHYPISAHIEYIKR